MAKQTHNPQANSGLRVEAVCCSRTNTLDKESCVGALHPAAIAKFSVRDLLSGASFGNRPHHNNGTFRGPNCPLNGGSLPAARLLAMLQSRAARTAIYEPAVATAYHALGDDASAYDWLEHSYRQRQPELRFLIGDSRFHAMSGDPRFIGLLGRLRLPR